MQQRKHYSYPSIPQFRTLLADVTHSARYIGQSAEGKPIYDENLPVPSQTLYGSVKLHGANCSVVLTKEGDFYPQSKETLLTEDVSCYGFYQYAMERKELFTELLAKYLIDIPLDVEAVVLYGEWCGSTIQGKVGIAQLEEPMFVVFDLRFIDGTYEQGGTGFINSSFTDFFSPKNRLYNVRYFKEWWLSLDVINPEEVQPKIAEATFEVEKKCPVAECFGIEGTGEGIVWHVFFKGKKYRMKTKGAKHSNTKVKTVAQIDVVKVNSINEFIEYAITENRMQQGLDLMVQRGEAIIKDNVGIFVAWVFRDVMKEESDALVKSGITSKDIAKKANYKVRQFYMSKLNEDC